jgi:hypothetical protein
VPLPPVTVIGLKVQVAPAGKPEQLKVTVPVKPLLGVTVTVVVALVPAAMLEGVNVAAEREKGASAWANANASTEPKPVTWS